LWSNLAVCPEADPAIMAMACGILYFVWWVCRPGIWAGDTRKTAVLKKRAGEAGNRAAIWTPD
jgi:hypothetical protein